MDACVPSNWYSKVEDSKSFGAAVPRKHISNDGGSNRRVTRLTDANQTTKKHKCPVWLEKSTIWMISQTEFISASVEYSKTYIFRNEWSTQCYYRPQKNSKRHQIFAIKPVTKVAKNWRENHVNNNERCLQKTSLGIRNRVVVLNFWQDTYKNKHSNCQLKIRELFKLRPTCNSVSIHVIKEIYKQQNY